MRPLKYELQRGHNKLAIPGGLCGHHFAFQYEKRGIHTLSLPRLWTNVSEELREQEVSIYVAGTGEEVPKGVLSYLGTAVNTKATYVLHAYLMQE